VVPVPLDFVAYFKTCGIPILHMRQGFSYALMKRWRAPEGDFRSTCDVSNGRLLEHIAVWSYADLRALRCGAIT